MTECCFQVCLLKNITYENKYDKLLKGAAVVNMFSITAYFGLLYRIYYKIFLSFVESQGIIYILFRIVEENLFIINYN